MLRVTDLAHLLVRRAVQPGDWVIDATVGNGHDTAFLAALVGARGRVFGFDVQAAAIDATRVRLPAQAADLFLAGHEQMAAHLPSAAHGRIAAVMFNLGYLPGAAKGLITRPETTCSAVRHALDLLAPGGLITLVLYRGHAGGAAEADAVRALALGLDAARFNVIAAAKLNVGTVAPELLAIERALTTPTPR